MAKKIKLVLSGSGLLYPCHAGAVMRLVQEGYEIEEVCGVSGGAIIAAALASGYAPDDNLVKLIKQTLPAKNNLIDSSLWTLFTKWGLIKGDKIEKMFDKYFAKTLSETKIPLHIIATDVSTQEKRIFSSSTDPQMSIAKAIRASMAIPFIFAPLEHENHLYVDGGWISNFPIDVFGDNENVIGIRFSSNYKKFEKLASVKQYIPALLNTSIEANMQEDISDDWRAKRIAIKTKHDSLNFSVTDQDVDGMLKDGWNSAEAWLKALK